MIGVCVAQVADNFSRKGLEERDLLTVCKPKDREDPGKLEMSINIMSRMQVREPLS